MFAGDTVTLDVSLLLSETITPPVGAGRLSVTKIGANCPGSTVTFDATRMSGGGTTVTPAAVSGTLGRALAWIMVVPVDPPATVTVALVAPATKVAVAGTLAAPGFAELKLMVTPPAGAGAERFSTTSCVAPAVTVRLCGEKLTAAVTCTAWPADR